eukprot:2405021-Amphidinium_carterae.1
MHGVGFYIAEWLFPFIDKVYLGHDRVAAFTLNCRPYQILILSIYLPTAGHTYQEKSDTYHRIHRILSDNTASIPILLGDFNSRVISRTGVEQNVGRYFFPNVYSLDTAPLD